MSTLKNEYSKLIKDLKQNITDQETLKYTVDRVNGFCDVVLKQMDILIEYDKDRMEKIEKKQQELEEKTEKIQEVIDNIERDIYDEDGFDFEIICPYCDNEFFIDVDENRTEVTCPKCQNIIELDWTGDLDDDFGGCPSGGCSSCSGNCGQTDEDDDM